MNPWNRSQHWFMRKKKRQHFFPEKKNIFSEKLAETAKKLAEWKKIAQFVLRFSPIFGENGLFSLKTLFVLLCLQKLAMF
jgi:hypothetical protein